MTALLENEDWNELMDMLRQAEQNVTAASNGNGAAAHLDASRQALLSFHTTAAMLSLPEFEQAGVALEGYLAQEVAPTSNPEANAVFGFAVNALMEEIDRVRAGGAPVQIEETLGILGVGDAAEAAAALTAEELPLDPLPHGAAEPVTAQTPSGLLTEDYQRLERIVGQYGGAVTMEPSPESGETLILRFAASPLVIKQVETLLSAGDPLSSFAPGLLQSDGRVDRVLATIKEFMVALSQGEVREAQGILLNLAEQQHQAGLYREIGGLARDLHTSLKGLMDTMDPALKEMVEERLPDSGYRLEHMLEITENAANTTIDSVEKMQRRNAEEQKKLGKLRELLGRLNAIGDQARRRLTEGDELLQEILEMSGKTHDELITVLMAQDYQDLTGQIIQKITKLLKDLELKLVNVIRTFGVKVESGKKAEMETLYGPAHKAKEEALHSQDDVDSLLAEFGF